MEKQEIGKKFIDIPKIVKDKNPKLYKRLPRFVIRLIERIVHVDEVNKYIYEWRDLYGLDWVAESIKVFRIKLNVTGIENIPSSGNQMVVANHPLGGFDGITLMHAVGKVRPDLKFPVNDILLRLPGLAPLLVPINKHGRNIENKGLLEEAFRSDRILLFFPAGLVSRKQKGGIRDLEWKHTFIKRAQKYHRDIIPTYIYAYNSKFFYNLAWWRKKLGIKANIEMLFLPGEVFKQFDKYIHIHFGEPIPWQTFDKSKSPRQWAQWVKDKVYEMGAEIEREEKIAGN